MSVSLATAVVIVATVTAITMPANLMGMDVGFSTTRRTTGIACLEGYHLTLQHAGTAWKSRRSLSFAPRFTIVADPAKVIMGCDWN
jgi:hypothetical protein